MTNYPVGDFLIRLKNASLARKKDVVVPMSKLIKSLALTLKDLGYLSQVEEEEGNLRVKIAYHKKEPLLSDVRIISKPGLRVYMGVEELRKRRGPYIALVSTPKGIMSSKKAIKERLGGEVIAEVL